MKRLILILFIISIGLIPIGMIFRIQHWPGGNMFFTLGLLGLLIYFITKTIKDLVKKSGDNFTIALQLLTILMSVTLFSRYLDHSFWDYPGLLVVPIFIVMSLVYLFKAKLRYSKLTITSITFLILSIPLFGFEFHKSPRQYIPKEWYNRFDIKGSVPINPPYDFDFKETEQLSVKAFDLEKSKHYYDAITVYRQALRIEPNNPKLLFDISGCYALINELESAISILDTAILLDNSYAPFYNNRGLLLYKLKENNKALMDYQKAIQLDSTQPNFYANIALVYYYEKDFRKASVALKRAKQLGLDLTSYKFLNSLINEN